MVDQIEHLWSMPPNPSYGCCVDDRYLVVSDAGVDEGPYKGFFSIVDLETGAHDMFVNTHQTPVYDIKAMNGYAWIWRASGILQRITPSSGGVETINTTTTRNSNTPIDVDPSRNLIFLRNQASTSSSSRALIAVDGDTGLGTASISGATWNGIVCFHPGLDRIVRISGTGVHLFDPEDMSTHTDTYVSTGQSIGNAWGAHVATLDNLLVTSENHVRLVVDTDDWFIRASESALPGVHGNLGDDGKWYTSTSSVVESFDINLMSINQTTLTSRGNRGTAIPVGNRLYIPAGSRPE